jgi:hypothetical protein
MQTSQYGISKEYKPTNIKAIDITEQSLHIFATQLNRDHNILHRLHSSITDIKLQSIHEKKRKGVKYK